ncbi:(Fe-S)-binding protein [Candidatus Spongiihabitans sp.]|uniref:(Fe-S)-binding protein n=1 Tax=Candidatus Spongiihabitans sp. TaxID=3101308 RepID=UPI003C7A02A7
MAGSDNNSTHHVGLFITCLADLFRPQVGFAAARLIEQCGCHVSVPQQSCCGQPAYNNGDDAKTRVLAKNLIEQFESFDYVVAPSGSCAAMVKVHYPKLFSDHPNWFGRARKLADKTYELSQFLVEVMPLKSPPQARRFADDKKITYHDSCSGLRELGIRSQPRKLLSQRAGIRIDEMDNSEICCGFGGAFCVKYPEISTRLVDNKISSIDKTEADIVLGGDLGCLMNIAGRITRCGKPTQVFHFAEWLLDEEPEAGIAQSQAQEISREINK